MVDMNQDWITFGKKVVAQMGGNPQDEDIVSEALIGAAEGLKAFDGRGDQDGYIVQRMRWKILEYWKLQRERSESIALCGTLEEWVPSSEKPPEVLPDDLFDSLNDKEKAIIQNCVIGDQTVLEYGKVAGWKRGLANYYKERALDKLYVRLAS